MGMLDFASDITDSIGLGDFLTGGAQKDMNKGYAEARRQLAPFIQPGLDSVNDMRRYSVDYGKTLDAYGNPADRMYRNINRSPNEYYDEIMRGYSESPEAKYLQGEAMRTANNGASASGMMGSGAYYKDIQNNAADIAERDRQRYFQNIMGVNQTQFQTLENFQNEQARRQQILQFLASIGYGAAGGSAQNSINQGLNNAALDQKKIQQMIQLGAMIGGGGMGGGMAGFA